MTGVNTVAGMDQGQFLALLIAGLKNQDPFQPMDSQSFLTQLSQITNVQALQSLNANFDQLLRLQQLTDGASLIGRPVTYVSRGATAAGRVSGLSAADGKILLTVGADQVGLDQILSVG